MPRYLRPNLQLIGRVLTKFWPLAHALLWRPQTVHHSVITLLYLDLPSDLPGSDARRRVAIERCKPCANPHDSNDIPTHLPPGLTRYVLNNLSKKSSPYHVTQDDVSTPLQRLEVEKISGHQSVRGRGGVIAVLYKTHWVGLPEPSWGREMDLHLSRSHILRYWAGTPDEHRQTNRLYRRMRIGAAQRELSRNNGERFLAPGYACVTRAEWLRRYRDTVLPKGAHFWYKGCLLYTSPSPRD